MLLLILSWLLPQTVLAAYQTPRMQRFGAAEGMPSRVVLQLEQDSKGYLWAATEDGLVRLDGTDLRVWQYDPDDPQSLRTNALESLALDRHDRVWVGTNGAGLLRLHADAGGFDSFDQVTAQCGTQVWSLATLADAVWVGSNGNGICVLGGDGSVRRIAVGDGPGQLPNGQIYSLRADHNGGMWIGTGAGLWRWEEGRLHQVGARLLGELIITRISVDRDNQLWVGSRERLWRLDSQEQLSEQHGPAGLSLRSAGVLDDRSGGRWVGTAAGLYHQSGADGTMQLLHDDAGSGFLTGNSAVLDMLQDHQGGLWFATLSQGLAYLPPDWMRFSTRYRIDGQLLESQYLINSVADGDGFLIGGAHGVYRLDADGALSTLADATTLGEGAVWSLLPLANGQILLGRSGMLSRIDRRGRLLEHIDLGTGNDAYHRVDLMLQASDGSIWMKVIGVGLQQRSADGQLLRQLRYGGPEGLLDSTITQLRQAPDGSLWLATETGVQRFDGRRVLPVEGIAVDYRAHDLVFAYHQLVWVAGMGEITRYQWEGGKAVLQQRIGREQGVPAVDIGGLLIGDSGQVWATTTRGLLRWSGRGGVQLYGVRDGLPDVEFSPRPPSRNGQRGLAISAAGIMHFDLDQPSGTLPAAQTVIDSIQLRDRRSQQLRSVGHDDGVVHLGPDDAELLVTARLLSFVRPDAHQYRFRIPGVDRDWVLVGADGRRVVGALPAGQHVMQVQARSGDGPWSVLQSLSLEVASPWWATLPARVAWAVVLLSLAGLAVWSLRRRLHRRLGLQRAADREQVVEQATQGRTRFLAALGHEVRTPMTGVLGMSELLLDTALDRRQRDYVDAIHHAGVHLLRLLNDALDMAGIEAGKLQLACQPFALGVVLEEVVAYVRPLAQAKGLECLPAPGLPGPVQMHGDATRLRQVLMNLMEHAIKHTTAGAVGITVHLEPLGRGLRLQVGNSAAGEVAASSAETVQAGNAGPRAGGLGLRVSEELVRAMGGSMEPSTACRGIQGFQLNLPLRWEMALPAYTAAHADKDSFAALQVLVVEDDPTVADVVCNLLRGRGHHVQHAAHGLQALALVATERFDVGLLDLDLPGIDGIALARQLRQMGWKMPLLAVTARADAAAEAEAMQAGFDAFVRKPVTGVLLAEALVRMTVRHERQPEQVDL